MTRDELAARLQKAGWQRSGDQFGADGGTRQVTLNINETGDTGTIFGVGPVEGGLTVWSSFYTACPAQVIFAAAEASQLWALDGQP